MKHRLIGRSDEKGNLATISYDGNEVVDLREKSLKEGADALKRWVKQNEAKLQKDLAENR